MPETPSEPPVVSVVIPLHDGERFLAAAIESALAQEGAELDVIVVDDGSRDSGPEIARSYAGVKVLSQPQRGVAAARNRAVRAARGEFIGFLDQDDEWVEGRVQRQVAYLRDHLEAEVVLGHTTHVIEPGTNVPPWCIPKLPGSDEHFPACMLGPILARREAFERVGLFDESYLVGSDSDWLLRVRDTGGEMHVVEDVVLRYRLHGENASYDLPVMKAEGMRVLRESIRRKKAAREQPAQ